MSQSYSITKSQKQALAIATAFALLFGAYFLREYVTLFIFAGILAFIFNPFYQIRLKKSGKPGRAAAQTLIVTFFAIVIPMMLVLSLTGLQINNTVRQLNSKSGGVDITGLSQQAIDKSNQVLEKTPSDFRITPEWVSDTGASLASKAGSFVQKNATTYAGSLFGFFTTAILFIFVFLSLLKNQNYLKSMVRDINPMGPQISDIYSEKVRAMTKAMVRGQFVIAIAQGFVGALTIYIGGVHEAFFFFFMLLTVLSIIPLGGGVVAIPIGAIMMLSGNIIGGAFVILGHIFITTNIDNILRPRLVPKEARLDSALTILSVFAGISLIGFLGIIVGPVLMIIIVTTIKVYLEVYKKPTAKQSTV